MQTCRGGVSSHLPLLAPQVSIPGTRGRVCISRGCSPFCRRPGALRVLGLVQLRCAPGSPGLLPHPREYPGQANPISSAPSTRDEIED